MKALVKPKETAIVILDSNHSKQHVLEELSAYSDLVTQGSYIVVTDGIMKNLDRVPRGEPDWTWNNPVSAVQEFLKERSEFVFEQPPWPFNESDLNKNVTHWPHAWLKRI